MYIWLHPFPFSLTLLQLAIYLSVVLGVPCLGIALFDFLCGIWNYFSERSEKKEDQKHD